ncbi:protein FAR1-RELATED SEQUENCE 5-like [Lactuca sativa]|uniref:protein FAR1-RELATED SEQUENCE 5-like n=1 Tax=Lactuca sativa TaxID=4236 RepID=UPI000CD8B4AA|nr:protein FAR1-RELATED SEQUENCE 5-like [Lactuca sativa]
MKPLDLNLAALSAKYSKDMELHLAKSLLSEMGQCIVWYLYLLLALIITKGASLLELVSWETMNESDFKADINGIVWDSKIVVKDFEMRWDALMVKYKLQDNKWMKDMFDLRSSWIPAYFKDVPMSGLIKTTSRSESENLAFNRVSHHGYTLNNFMNTFEFVMERKRNNQIKFDFDTSTIIPTIKTPFDDMEKHASMVYTRTIFLMVQREILHSLVSCSQKSVTLGVVSDIHIFKHKRTNLSKKKVVVEKKEKVDILTESLDG